MGKSKISRKTTFQSVLDYKFTFKKQYCKKEAAMYVGVLYDTFQRYCNGYLNPGPDRSKSLIHFVYEKDHTDLELLQYFCPPGILLIQAAEYEPCKKEREKKELGLLVLLGKTIESIEKAYDDDRIERNEWKEIHRLLTQIRRCCAELDKQIAEEIG